MPHAATPNRDPAAIKRVLQDQAEAAQASGLGLADVAKAVASMSKPKGDAIQIGDATPHAVVDNYITTPPPVSRATVAAEEAHRKPRKRKPTRTPRVTSGRIQVDSDVPPPGDAFGALAYPFATMRVGDSFFVEKEGRGFTSVTNANRSHAPKVFTSRYMTGDDPKHPGKTGYRVWRVK